MPSKLLENLRRGGQSQQQGRLIMAAADEIERLRADFAKLRLGICDHATDTVWIDERGTTAVDFISMILDDGDWYNEIYLPAKEVE